MTRAAGPIAQGFPAGRYHSRQAMTHGSRDVTNQIVPALQYFRILVLVVVAAALSGCGYNNIQTADEGTKQAWAEVVNQYQRRADLIPNLVNTVKGYAQQEKEVLTQVTEARSRFCRAAATTRFSSRTSRSRPRGRKWSTSTSGAPTSFRIS